MDFELLCIGVFALCGCAFFILFLIWFQGTPQHEAQADDNHEKYAAVESMIMSSGDIDHAGNLAGLTSLGCHSSNYFVKRLSRSLTAERSALIMPCIVREFSFEQIEAATGKLSSSCIIKKGHSGDIYKGVLEGGETVIIKRIYMRPTSKDVNYSHSNELLISKDSYIGEMDIYGKVLDHSFLVPVLGQCLAKEDKFLVYEYMPYGDLATILAKGRAASTNYVHGNPKSSSRRADKEPLELPATAAIQEENEEDEDNITLDLAEQGGYPFKACRLTWPVRMRIAREVAEGLAYLHHESRPPLSHRNIKGSSILLNKELEVKLGSLGDAQKIESGELPAYDIYCFGRVLLDLISGMDISGMKCSSRVDEEAQAWISKCFNVLSCSSPLSMKDLLLPLIDKELLLLLQEHHALQILQVAKLAKLCMEPTSLQKLSMKRVLHLLPSFNSSQRAPSSSLF